MLLKVDLQIERAVAKGWQYEGTDDPLSLLQPGTNGGKEEKIQQQKVLNCVNIYFMKIILC